MACSDLHETVASKVVRTHQQSRFLAGFKESACTGGCLFQASRLNKCLHIPHLCLHSASHNEITTVQPISLNISTESDKPSSVMFPQWN